MPFEPNHQLSTGRPKGSGNKNLSKIREAYQNLIEDNLTQIQKDIDSIEPHQRLKFIIDLSAFVLPKMKQVASTVINEPNQELTESEVLTIKKALDLKY